MRPLAPLLLSALLAACAAAPGGPASPASSSSSSSVASAAATADVFLIAIETPEDDGTTIGCGDSTVAVQRAVTGATLPYAVQELLSLQRSAASPNVAGYYNALYQSDLHVASATMSGSTAVLALTGTLLSGGTCDDPRIYWQISDTATQFPGVDAVTITVNGNPLDQSGGAAG